MAGLQRIVLLLEVVQNVAHTQSRAACLLAVGGADALSCGAHFVLSLGCLIGAVEHTVRGQDEMGALADVQTALEVVTGSLQLMCLGSEQVGSYHAAVAYDVQFALIEDA